MKEQTPETVRFKQQLTALRLEISGDIVDELFISFQSVMDAENKALKERVEELEKEIYHLRKRDGVIIIKNED